MEQALFDKGEAVPPSPGEVAAAQTMAGNPRLRVPQRDQIEMHWASLNELLEPEHPARMVWACVCGLDLGQWLKTIKAVEGVVGRDATDPRLLVALWIYATIEGVGSARELERLCQKHLVYQWLCGGVSVNYHLLSDFRSRGGDKWDDLLTQLVASLLAEKLVALKRVAQDGMRVRASAGAASFRRRPRLERFLAEALDHCDQLQQQREETAKITGKKPTEARASTTDPEARTMKFPDGGFASLNAIDDAAQRGCTVYAPLKDEQKQLAAGKDPYAAKRYDSVAVASWRERMGTAAGKLIYRLRGQTAEWVNAVCRNRGLYQMPVRGGSKCRTVAVLYAIAHDMVRGAALRAQVAATGG